MRRFHISGPKLPIFNDGTMWFDIIDGTTKKVVCEHRFFVKFDFTRDRPAYQQQLEEEAIDAQKVADMLEMGAAHVSGAFSGPVTEVFEELEPEFRLPRYFDEDPKKHAVKGETSTIVKWINCGRIVKP